MKKKNEGYLETRNNVVDLSLLAFSITYLPVNILNILRAMSTGWTLFTYVFPFIVSVFILTYLLRNKISFKIKRYILIYNLIIIGLMTYITNGMLGLGGAVFLVAVALTAITSSRKQLVVVYLTTVVFVILARILITQDIVEIVFDVEQFFYSPTAWTGQLIGYLTLSIVIVVGLIASINNNEKVLVNTLRTLDDMNSILDTIKHPIIVIDQNRNIRYMNKVFAQIIERDKTELVGKTLTTLFTLDVFSDLSTQVKIKKMIDTTFGTKRLSKEILKFKIGKELRKFLCLFDLIHDEESNFDLVVISSTETTIMEYNK